MVDTTVACEGKIDRGTREPDSPSAEFQHPVKQEDISMNDCAKLSDQPESLAFAPYPSVGLLDRIAGFDRLFPDDSAREGDLARLREDQAWKTPKTIKVKAKGAGIKERNVVSTREGRREEGGERQEDAAGFRRNEEPRMKRKTGALGHEMTIDGQPRKIRPRNSLREWSSANEIYADSPQARSSTFSKSSKLELSAIGSGRGNGSTNGGMRTVAGMETRNVPRSRPVPPSFLATSPHPNALHPVYPAPSSYRPPPYAAQHNARNARDANVLSSLPYMDQDMHHGGVTDADDDDEIVFLGERRSFGTANGAAPSWSSMTSNRGYWVPVEEHYVQPTTAQKMDQIVQLLLVAAQALDEGEVAANNRKSSVNSGPVHHMHAGSLAIPASLSPLYTLAALGTERIQHQDVKELSEEEKPAPVHHISPKKPASSVWIRGGHRSSNKEALAIRNKKPYDRPPSKSTSTESTDSAALHWYTDFPTFEKQAVERKRSISSRGSVLSGHASLSNMPSGTGKKVTFRDHVYEGKLDSRTESVATEAKGLSRDRVEPGPGTKGRPSSSSPTKRSRDRPRKVTVKVEEDTDDFDPPRESRPKPEPSEKRVTTRSGRQVKAVQY